MAGLFGRMFDLNRDGKLDAWERAMEYDFMTSLNDEDDGCEDEDEELTELELAGIDPIELEYMDANERREVLEEAGLDPDEFDF
ncbi:MAG: hypothetical protein IKW30_02910 [Lachnospiraceae bacterium]|nr:hypothetical protein [Lachnospiraceae bacterium]